MHVTVRQDEFLLEPVTARANAEGLCIARWLEDGVAEVIATTRDGRIGQLRNISVAQGLTSVAPMLLLQAGGELALEARKLHEFSEVTIQHTTADFVRRMPLHRWIRLDGTGFQTTLQVPVGTSRVTVRGLDGRLLIDTTVEVADFVSSLKLRGADR